MLNSLSTCAHDRHATFLPATAVADAGASDPTETSGLRRRMKAEARQRWQSFARMLRQGLVEHDVVGLRGIGRLPHGDKTEGFATWIAGDLAHRIFAQGLWLKPYIRKAAEIAQAQSRKRVSIAAAVDPSRVRAIESLAAAELKGIVEAAQQQLTRAATHRMMANHSPYKIANALAVVVKSMSRRTDALAGDIIARAHATATLSAYRSVGVTHVGIIPEHVPSPLHGLSFRVPDRAMIGDMTQIEIANLVGEEEARKIRQWRSGTRAASPAEKAEWRQLGIVGATEGEVETVGEIRPPLPTLIEKARKHWREQFTKLAKRHGTQGALQRVETQLAAEAPRLTRVGGEFRKKLSAGTKEFVAQAKARGEATRALQAIVREDLYQRAAELSGYRKPSYGRPGPGSRVGREETPSPATIARIEKAQARLEAVLGKGLVTVMTREDDLVCPLCEDISDESPYSLDEAEGLIPAHPNCRCYFLPAGKYEKDALHDGDEPGHPFRGNQYTGGGKGSGMIAGVYFRGPVSRLEALQKARREGAGRAEIEKMVASFKSTEPAASAPASSLYGWPPEKEAQYQKFLRGGSAGPEREGSKWQKEFSERFAKHGYRKDAAAIKEAAGVMFRVPSGHMLLMKRQDTGEWALPAGMLEENELPLHGAQREAAEETGFPGDVRAEKIDERIHNGLRFHTFLQPVAAKFEPILNSEHTDWGWFHLDDIPWPLIPGLAATLRKIDDGEINGLKGVLG